MNRAKGFPPLAGRFTNSRRDRGGDLSAQKFFDPDEIVTVRGDYSELQRALSAVSAEAVVGASALASAAGDELYSLSTAAAEQQERFQAEIARAHATIESYQKSFPLVPV